MRPKFKAGDLIRCPDGMVYYQVISVNNECYLLRAMDIEKRKPLYSLHDDWGIRNFAISFVDKFGFRKGHFVK